MSKIINPFSVSPADYKYFINPQFSFATELHVPIPFLSENRIGQSHTQWHLTHQVNAALKLISMKENQLELSKELFGLDTYIVGEESSNKVVVILTDVNGNHFNNVLLIADTIAKMATRS